ncbi:hypothetical protein NX059_007228 [Plenodomus lindquistii]|nr:hypothetical protein NX059_007228 [Plenodomus lindquistii]
MAGSSSLMASQAHNAPIEAVPTTPSLRLPYERHGNDALARRPHRPPAPSTWNAATGVDCMTRHSA